MGLDADLETTVKLYPFPRPERHLKVPRDWAQTHPLQPLPRKYWDHSTHVIHWMGRNALRRLAVYWDANAPLPSVEELELWIEDHSTKAEAFFKPSKLSKMCRSAAEFALDVWDPEVLLERRRRARNGGLKTAELRKANPVLPTRGAVFTVDMLQALEPGLSIAKQATALGCSTATVSRLRAEQKTIKAQEAEAELDALMPQQATSLPVTAQVIEPGPFDYLLDGGDAPPITNPETTCWPPNTTADLPDGWAERSNEAAREAQPPVLSAERTESSRALRPEL